MKLNKMGSAMVALSFAAILGTSAHAQSAGDLIIGFEQTGNDNVYEVDLGSASQFLDPTSASETFNLSSSDLSAYFGGNWATVTTNAGPPATNAVQWGIIGANTTAGSLTLGSSTLAKNTVLTTWNTWAPAPKEGTTNGETTTVSDINALYNDVANNGTPTAGSTSANPAIVTSASQDGNSFADQVNPGANFNLGAGAANSPLDNNSAASFAPADSLTLDLYELTPTNASPSSLQEPTTLLGTFNLSSGGVLTFDAATAPEPSVYLMMALGGLVLLWRLRRNAGQA